jgi:hypothetical protein
MQQPVCQLWLSANNPLSIFSRLPQVRNPWGGGTGHHAEICAWNLALGSEFKSKLCCLLAVTALAKSLPVPSLSFLVSVEEYSCPEGTEKTGQGLSVFFCFPLKRQHQLPPGL